MRVLHLSLLLLTLTLSSCGGGGSGGTAGTGASGGDAGVLSFGALSPSAITAKLSDDPAAVRQQVALSAAFSGSAGGTIYVVVEDPDKVVTGAIPTVSAGTASLTLDLATGLSPGRYTRSVVVHACKDAACKGEFAGSPQTLSKDVVVETLAVGAAALSFRSDVGVGAPAQAFSVTPPVGKGYTFSGGAVDYQAPSGAISQLPFDAVFDVMQTETGLQVKPKGAWAGEYRWAVGLQSTGYALKSVPVVYQVGDGSAKPLTLLTPTLAVTAGNGVVFADIDVLKNYAYGGVQIAITGTPNPTDQGWLLYYDSLPYVQGTASLDNATHLRFRFDPCGYSGAFGCLSSGSYQANIHVEVSAGGQSWPYDVPVTFTVP